MGFWDSMDFEQFNLHLYYFGHEGRYETSKTDMNRRLLLTLMLKPFVSAPVYTLMYFLISDLF